MGLNTGLVSFWKLDETSGTRYDSVGSNNLTDNNSVGYTTGVISNAANFNSSSQYLSVASNSGLSPTSALSLSFWIKPASTGGATYVIASKWSYNVNQGWFIRVNGGELEIGLENYSVTAITSGLSLSTSAFSHVVMVYDGSGSGNSGRLKLYVNNSSQTLTYGGTVPSSITATTNQLEIGAWSSVGYYYYGAQDLFGFWSSALNSTDVSDLYNSGAGLEPPFPSGATGRSFGYIF